MTQGENGIRTDSHDFYNGKRVLITGGLGFIGSSLAHQLVPRGARVSIIDRELPETGANRFNLQGIEKEVEVCVADLAESTKSAEAVAGKDIIFNLAGLLAHSDSMRDPLRDLHGNCVAQVTFLEACRKVNPAAKIVYTGSRNEYGLVKEGKVDEEHQLDPSDINSIHLVAANGYHLLYARVYDMRVCVLRLPNVFGPRHQMQHPRQGVLNWFVRQVLDGEEISLYGDGTQIRDSNYVDDVVVALLLAGESSKGDGQIFNLGGLAISLKEYVEALIRVNGSGSYRTIPFPPDAKKIEIGDYIADTSKIKKLLGWVPKVTLEEGLRRTVVYYQAHRKHYWEATV